ncbi:hypothetical protein KPL76_00390 [Subtercola sp. PAMC28395]|uniref:hypothetical protein n=1 Tax=Subtercola sp. PAMC28395 TaxID=2846775 RepID=UPI001C0C2B21|nr:hypothetical protein [Subtercola sp. PAMC28395]QWT23951.1 hypothetical protein KPL76_00390 [Subtercola sp. PAMC28395]
MNVFRFAATFWAVLALALNAYIHFTLAPEVSTVEGSLMNLGTLYLIEAAVNTLAAILLVIRPRLWTAVFAILVALAGLAMLVASVWMPVHLPFGLPMVPMSSWTTEKAVSAAAQFLVLFSGTIIAVTGRPRT